VSVDADLWLGDAVSLYREGRSVEEVGRSLGVSGETVRRHLRNAGVSIRSRGPVRGSARMRYATADITERRGEVARLAAEGKSDYEIGRALGVSKTTIAADRRSLGIAPRSPGRPPLSPVP
jgi:DNA-binding CsgD family transcriptional regulator